MWASTITVFLAGALATALVPLAVPVLGPLSHEFGIAGSKLGWIVSFPSLLCAFGALGFGFAVDRFGDIRLLLAGTVLAILGDLGVALAPHLSWLFAARLFQGVSYGCLSVAGPAFLQRTIAGDRRRVAMALWAAHTPMGFAAAVFLGAQLVAAGASWRFSFLGHAALALIIGLALFPLRRAHSATMARRSAGTRDVLASPKVHVVALGACAAALLQTGVMVTLPTALATRFGLATPQAALAVLVAMVANWAGGMLIVATALRRAPRIALPLFAVAATATSAAMLLHVAPTLPLDLALVVGFSATLGAANSLIWSLLPLAAPFPEAAGATAGLITQGSFIGVLTGPPALFALLNGPPILILACAALLTLLMGVALAATGGGDRPQQLPAAGGRTQQA
jgi:predicted MFS family arabinose efflux permease